MTDRLQPVEGWRQFEQRIAKLTEPGGFAEFLSPEIQKRIEAKYPPPNIGRPKGLSIGSIGRWLETTSPDTPNPEAGFSMYEVGRAIAARNASFVWDAYEVYLDACAYNTESFKPPSETALGIPIAAAVHYGCGLLGLWHPLSYYRQPQYFRYGQGGWSTLTQASRKRFAHFYSNVLPLRAHLASNPFLQGRLFVFLDATGTTVDWTQIARLTSNDLCFLVRKESSQALHKWLTTSNDLDDFLDGVDLKDEKLKTELLGAQIFNEKEWEELIAIIDKAASGWISKTKNDAKRAMALRMLIVANYSALHLRLFEGVASHEAALNPLDDVKGILSCVVPLYTRTKKDQSSPLSAGTPKLLRSVKRLIIRAARLPTKTKRESSAAETSAYEFSDFANYIAGYGVKDNEGLNEAFEALEKQAFALEQTITCFARVEQLARTSGASSLRTENVIRECCLVESEVLAHVNEWGRWFRKEIGNERFVSDFSDDLTENNEGMVGASYKMLDLFGRLKQRASNRHSPEGAGCKHGKLKIDFRTLFLYSEPGCGKENLAKLIHLLGQLENDTYVDVIEWCGKCNKELKQLTDANDKERLAAWLNGWNDFDKEDPQIKIHSGKDLEVRMSKRPTNYYVLNCGEANTRDDLKSLLFGKFGKVSARRYAPDKRSGAILAGHLTAGTVFLDEFNTLDRSLDATFLRFLEKPYRYSVTFEGNMYSPNAQVLMILASNKDKDELVRDGRNPAVVFRATENFFRIPPLRERKEDIAIFVLHQLLAKKNAKAANEYSKCIHRLNTEGMRLICEMNWEENYRGVRSFLNTLLENREIRQLKEREISFDEVVEALQKIEALRSGPSRLSD